MVICSNLTVSTARNAGKVLLCGCVRVCLCPHMHTNARPSTTAATFSERRSLHRAARPRARRMEARWKWNNRKRAVALAISPCRHTHSHTPRACADTLRMQTFCRRNRLFFCAHEHPRKKDLAASSAQMAILSSGETALSGPAVLTIGTILWRSQCPPCPPTPFPCSPPL